MRIVIPYIHYKVPILSDVKALNDFKNYTDKILWISPQVDDLVDKMRQLLSFSKDKKDNYKKELNLIMKKNFGIKVGALAYAKLYSEILKSGKAANISLKESDFQFQK